MFLRSHKRCKDGKEHRYFSVEESRRLRSGKVVQRRVLYLGEINDSQQAAWRKSLEVFDEAGQRYTTLSLFPEDREAPAGVRQLLAGMRTVEATASGWVLEAETASGQGAGELGSGAGVAGSESPDRSRQRIPRTPPVVRAKRPGRTAGRRFRGGGQRSPVPLFGSRAGAQAGVVHTLAPALARSVRCPFRFVA